MLSKRLGLTLLELLISIVIIVIITMISIPSVISLLQNHRLAASAELLYYNLQLARSEALRRNSTVYISFTTGSNWCYGINVGSTCNCAIAGSCGLGAVSPNTSTQTTLSAVGYGSNYISFESSHGAANSSGSLTFTIYQGNNLIKLSIGQLGNIQMCSTGVGGYSAC